MAIVTGIFVSYGINFLLRNVGPENWRWMFFTGVVPSMVFFILLLNSPETPNYLMKANREKEAFVILERINGPMIAELRIAEIRASLSVGKRDWRRLLQPDIRRPVLVGFCLAILVQVS